AIHFIYAALWRIWPHDAVVPAADAIAAGVVAWLLVILGRRTSGDPAGFVSAAIFLLLANPAIQRLSGVRVRAQCETFIAVAVTAAFVLAMGRGGLALGTGPSTSRGGPWRPLLAGAALGCAF